MVEKSLKCRFHNVCLYLINIIYFLNFFLCLETTFENFVCFISTWNKIFKNKCFINTKCKKKKVVKKVVNNKEEKFGDDSVDLI